jgi:phosphoribosylformylglycinamidine synthase subunit PurL
LGELWGFPPALEIEREAALQKALLEMIQAALVDSAHDCSDGGIAVTLAESALPRSVGARIDLSSNDLPLEFVLFGEDASRIVISCDPGRVAAIKQIAGKFGISADSIGETVADNLEIRADGRAVVSSAISELCSAYEGALEKTLSTEPVLIAD